MEQLKTNINHLEAIKTDISKQRFLNKGNNELLFDAMCCIKTAIEKLVLAVYYAEEETKFKKGKQ